LRLSEQTQLINCELNFEQKPEQKKIIF